MKIRTLETMVGLAAAILSSTSYALPDASVVGTPVVQSTTYNADGIVAWVKNGVQRKSGSFARAFFDQEEGKSTLVAYIPGRKEGRGLLLIGNNGNPFVYQVDQGQVTPRLEGGEGNSLYGSALGRLETLSRNIWDQNDYNLATNLR
ncbi:hypothetical protein HYX12_02435 [Candidatus Woesearchaeota archaeon]|nr:hypothetical protein [Candidatus Woesearchaeota archaeon]